MSVKSLYFFTYTASKLLHVLIQETLNHVGVLMDCMLKYFYMILTYSSRVGIT